jgi:acyl-CoA synthetase
VTDDEQAGGASMTAEYHRRGWWGTATIAGIVAGQAAGPRGGQPAFLGDGHRLSWAQYDEQSTRLAALLAQPACTGLRRGERVAVWLPDGPLLHVVYLALEKAGGVIVGISARAGPAELRHLLARTSATTLVSLAEHRGRATAAVAEQLRADGLTFRHLVLGARGATAELDGRALAWPDAPGARPGPGLGADDLWLVNSTSGTTGLPKCVMHSQNRWMYFHRLAVEAGALTAADTWLSALPSPFGFGIWTAHVTPAILGCPTVLTERFSPDEVLSLIGRHRVTVLACVSTQLVMLLNAAGRGAAELASLRVVFTGGEAVPYDRAARFEDRFGVTVLQFFGSNETGALSRTTLADSREARLRTAGRVIGDMQVRLFDEAGADVTATGRGIPAGRGPATCLGYLDDAAANAKLRTADGWMLMGDVVELDRDGYLTVIGRTADVIIRGGTNISAAQVEEAVASHPAVALAAAVAVADPVFGERVCVFAELTPGRELQLDGLRDHLRASGVSPQLWPERLEVLPALPLTLGGKVAKAELRRRASGLPAPRPAAHDPDRFTP